MERLTVYGSLNDPFTNRALTLIRHYGHSYTLIDVGTEEGLKDLYNKGLETFPQIFLGEEHLGGFRDLVDYIEAVAKIAQLSEGR